MHGPMKVSKKDIELGNRLAKCSKPERMKFNIDDIPKSSGQEDDVYVGYEKGWKDGQDKLLHYLITNSHYVPGCLINMCNQREVMK